MDMIRVRGARENNLKNINVDIPKNKITVITGLSGSGKSSLAYDTIYAEGQRRFIESLSSHARHLISQLDEPDVDSIEGLSPTIAISQNLGQRNPRSIVATITDIYDYLRVLYSRIGTQYCPNCGNIIKQYHLDTIVDEIMMLPSGTKFILMVPIKKEESKSYNDLFDDIYKWGFARVRINGDIVSLSGDLCLEENEDYTIDIVVDRIIMSPDIKQQLMDSLSTCAKVSSTYKTNRIIVAVLGENGVQEKKYSLTKTCTNCFTPSNYFQPRDFSFSTPHGACKECSGLGTILEVDPDKVIPDRSLSINQGAIATINADANWYKSIFNGLASHFGFSLDTPFKELPNNIIDIILYGSQENFNVTYMTQAKKGKFEYSSTFSGVLKDIKKRYIESTSDKVKEWLESFMAHVECPECKGMRLKKEVCSVKIGGKNIMEFISLSVDEAAIFLKELILEPSQAAVADRIIREICARLEFMSDVGLGYLSLDRPTSTLSGGELQRVRLATQIGSGLDGVLYILDEPTAGLHCRDNERLLNSLVKLKELGNTLIVVEHDEQTIRRADYIVDMGPSAGVKGGEVVGTGTVDEITKNEKSITGLYLSGKRKIGMRKYIRRGNGKTIEIRGVSEHNLKSINVSIPLQTFTVITGVSGSGKSTLLIDTLYPAIYNRLNKGNMKEGKYESIHGIDNIDSIINIDQSPIGRTPRSNPATYLGFMDEIRDLYASLPEAKVRGFKPGHFSFNTKGGRCENCNGDGRIKVNMLFLPDVYVVCNVCNGKRFNDNVLSIMYEGKNIYDVLEMTVSEALLFFKKIPNIANKISILEDIGLGYLKLGQPANTLSGGEAQRLKLAFELSKKTKGHTVYLLDEPTTGLHFADIEILLDLLQQLVDKGNTVILIEHNMDVIRQADYIIDIGPEGGANGGRVVFAGTPDNIKNIAESYTGRYL